MLPRNRRRFPKVVNDISPKGVGVAGDIVTEVALLSQTPWPMTSLALLKQPWVASKICVAVASCMPTIAGDTMRILGFLVVRSVCP